MLRLSNIYRYVFVSDFERPKFFGGLRVVIRAQIRIQLRSGFTSLET